MKTFFSQRRRRRRRFNIGHAHLSPYIPGYTVPKEIDFPRYNLKCSGENMIHTTRNILCIIMVSTTFNVLDLDYFFGQCRRSINV